MATRTSVREKKEREEAEAKAAAASLEGAPPLFPGEQRAGYEALHARLVAAVAPRNPVEELWVEDVAILTWEMQRLRRVIVGIVNVRMPDALTRVLSAAVDDFRAEGLAKAWRVGDADARARAEAHLAEMQLSLDDVAAEAMRLEIHSIDKVHAMLAQAEARRNAALREIDRWRELLAARLGAAAAIEDAAFATVPPVRALAAGGGDAGRAG